MTCSSAPYQDAPGPGFSWGCNSCSVVELVCGEEIDINSESEWGERREVVESLRLPTAGEKGGAFLEYYVVFHLAAVACVPASSTT